MSSLHLFIEDVCCGFKDCLSGWYVAVKCWRVEAEKAKKKKLQTSPQSQSNKSRREVVKQRDGNLLEIIWNMVTTAAVALLITFAIEVGCSALGSLLGPRFERGMEVAEWLLSFLWWIPSMVVIKLTSIISNNEVADKVFIFKYGQPKYQSIGLVISEFIFSIVYQFLFTIQADILCALVPWPRVALLLEWLHYSLFYALYAFEYKWALLGVPGHKRVAQIEENWPYYVAFGLPIHLLVAFWDSRYTRTMTFTLLFPFSILGATAAVPPHSEFTFPIHIMYPSVFFTDEFYKIVGKVWKASLKKQDSAQIQTNLAS